MQRADCRGAVCSLAARWLLSAGQCRQCQLQLLRPVRHPLGRILTSSPCVASSSFSLCAERIKATNTSRFNKAYQANRRYTSPTFRPQRARGGSTSHGGEQQIAARLLAHRWRGYTGCFVVVAWTCASCAICSVHILAMSPSTSSRSEDAPPDSKNATP